MDLHAILRTRRILVAALIVTVLTLGSVVAAGFGGKDLVAAAPLPATFRMPEARVGDRGNYTWDHIRLDAAGNATVTDGHDYLGFEWQPAKPMRDKDGRLHDTNTLHTWGWQRCHEGDTGDGCRSGNGGNAGGGSGDGWERYAEPVYSIDRTDLSMVAYAYVSETAADPNQRYGGAHMLQAMLLGKDDNFAPFCGAYSPFQGRAVPLGEGVQLFDACMGEGSGFAASMEGSFRAMGVQTLDGHSAILFSSGESVHVWYDPEIPVPIRIAVQDWRHPGEYDVLRLTRFARGNEPVTWGGAAPLGPAPEWVMAPLVDKLPDETGVTHTFSAHAALAAARASGNAQAFFDVLDRGYVSSLGYQERLDHSAGPVATYSWYYNAIDGDKQAGLMVTLTNRTESGVEAGPAGPVPLPVPLPPPVGGGEGTPTTRHNTTIEVQVNEGNDRAPFASPVVVAGGAPTVASMLARWRAFASDEYQGRAGNSWGFRVMCYPDCGTGAYEFRAGHESSETWTNGTAQEPVYASVNRGSELRESNLEGRGHEATLSESTYRWTQGGSAPARASALPSSSDMTLQHSFAWVAPGASLVAGTGAAALLVGLAYLLWPALKSGAMMGLFSRVHSADELQSHPVRRQVLQLVEAQPGIHMRELQRRLGLGRNQATHHVGKLRDAGLIRMVAGPGYTCVFPRGTDKATMGAAPAMKADAARRILRAAVAHPGLSARAVAREAGISPGTLSHHLPRLRSAGLLSPEATGLVPTDLGRRVAAAP